MQTWIKIYPPDTSESGLILIYLLTLVVLAYCTCVAFAGTFSKSSTHQGTNRNFVKTPIILHASP